MERVRSIDAFRGVAIILMVFFTLMVKLTQDPFFQHNLAGEVHVGDFVFPLFLFASGMSIVFFMKKRKDDGKTKFRLDVIERFGKLFGIGLILSLFSAGALFGMDEVSLSAILFVLAVLVMGFSNVFYILVSFMLAILYFALSKLGLLTIFDSSYLGGYQGAIFYLPVMLAGVVLGKGILERKAEQTMKILILFSLVTFALSYIVFPIDKTRVSPSFMALSVVIGTVFFAGVYALVERKWINIPVIEHLGKNPIRYWVLMFVFFIIPYVWCVVLGACKYPLDYSLPEAFGICFAFMCLFGFVSYGYEMVKDRWGKK